MKKIMLAVSMVLGVLFTTSCDSDTEEFEYRVDAEPQTEVTTDAGETTEVDEAAELRNLQEQLVKLQETYGKAIKKGTQANPITSTVAARNVFKADLMGAWYGKQWGVWGSLACGVVSSACSYYYNKKYFNLSTMNGQNMVDNLKATTIQTGCENSSIDSLGYWHNKVIMGIGVKNLQTRPYRDLKRLAIEGVYKLSEEASQAIPTSVLNNDEGISFLEHNMTRLNSAADAKSYCDILREGITTTSEEEMDFMEEYMNGLDVTVSVNGDYVKKAAALVQGSKLSTETKERILCGFVVGNASVMLWGNATTTTK